MVAGGEEETVTSDGGVLFTSGLVDVSVLLGRATDTEAEVVVDVTATVILEGQTG